MRYVIALIAMLMLAIPGGGGTGVVYARPNTNDHPTAEQVEKRIWELLPWVLKTTGYKADIYFRYVVEFASPQTLARMYYGPNYKDQTDIEAVSLGNTVWLADHFQLGRDDYVLVHELVHLLQFENAAEFPCMARQEYEAYHVQAKWVSEFKSGQMPDLLYMIMLSTCPRPVPH
jgi:hypothetical protein